MWHELCTTKYNCDYLSALVRKHRKIHLVINGFIAFFSTLGLTLQQRFDWAATAGLAVSLLGIFSKHIGPFWLMSDDQLTSLDREHAFYELYLSQLERLWIQFEQESKSEAEVLQEFYILKDRESEHVVALNQLSAYFRINSNSIHKKANDYVQAVFIPKSPDHANP